MTRKVLALAAAALTALALSAAPASAHFNSQVGSDTAPSTAPGFVGPNGDSPNYVTAHSGIECAAGANPNIASIATFECPADTE